MIGRHKLVTFFAVIAAPFVLGPAPASASSAQSFTLVQTFTLPNNEVLASFDISWVDEFDRLYMLADRSANGIDLLDLNTNQFTFLVPTGANAFQGPRIDPNIVGPNDVSGPNGVVTVNHAEVWATDAPTFSGPIVQNTNPAIAYAADNCDSTVKVFDLFSRQLTDVIDTGGCFRADELAFDPVDQVVIVANPGEQNIGKGPTRPFVTIISAAPVLPGQHHPILRTITFDGTKGTPDATAGIEQPIWSPKSGLLYVALPQNGPTPTVGGVVVINPKPGSSQFRVMGTIPVNNCTPGGMALDATNTELFLGCSLGPMQIINPATGALVASFPQAVGADEVAYNGAVNDFGCACGDNPAGPIVGIISAAGPTFVQDISTATFTKGNPHSISADPVTGFFFVPLPTTDTQCPTGNGCIAVYANTAPSG